MDDDKNLLEIVKTFLEETSTIRVETAISAQVAQTRLSNTIFDAIVSDYEMPSMNGIEFLKLVRKKHGDIPFILFTGKGREEVVIQAINHGADFYLQKGGDPESQFAELSHKIRQAVKQRRAQARIRDHERREADIINFLPDATFAIDTRGVVIAWNKAMEEMTGVAASDMLGKGNYEYSIPFYHERRPILIDLVFKEDTATAQRYSFIKKEGKSLFSEITIPHFHQNMGASLWFTASPLYDSKGTIVGAIESIRDITERKVAEETLRQSEALYRNVVEDQTEFISRFLPDGTHVFVNESYCRYFNMSREELIGKKFAPAIPVEDRQMVTDHFRKLTPENPVASINHRIILTDGSTRWHRWSDRAIFDEKNVLNEYQSVGRDITDMKQTEETLRQKESVLRSMFDATPVGVVLLVNRVFQKVNRSLCTMTGYSEEEMIGQSTRMLYPDDEEYLRAGQELYGKMETEGLGTVETRFRRKDGAIINVILSVSPFDPEKLSSGVTGTIMDITERKKAEEAIKQVNRQLNLMTSITRHDILNNIMAMLSYLAISRKKNPGSEMQAFIERLESVTKAMKSQIEFTRVYQDLGNHEPQWHDAGYIVSDLDIPSAINLQSELPGVEIFADPLLKKVFYNLLDNAVRHGGNVTHVIISCWEVPQGLVLTFEDDGVGIPASEKDRIFERGFGKNNGFGLFLVREILSITGISIKETGTEGKGARFEILVPKGAYRFNLKSG